MSADIAEEFGKLIAASFEVRRDLATKAEAQKRWDAEFAAVPAWIKAKSTEELGEMWANCTDECIEFCDEVWRELRGRGRGDLCPI